jgi:holo-[acyl-carrier protein] synthase
MVVGIGTDLTEIERVRRTIERFGERFLHRVYTAGEIAYCMRKKGFAESFAARFAAKEAAAKALGTGISRGVGWQEFEVVREPGGRPTLLMRGRAEEISQTLGVVRVSLSLTHTRDLAMAVVVMEDGT